MFSLALSPSQIPFQLSPPGIFTDPQPPTQRRQITPFSEPSLYLVHIQIAGIITLPLQFFLLTYLSPQLDCELFQGRKSYLSLYSQ